MPAVLFADMFQTFTQVVDHSGSAEEGADLIYAQLEKVIKQVLSSITLLRSQSVLCTEICSHPSWDGLDTLLAYISILTMQELLGLEGADVDSKDSGIEEGREEDSGDVLWDLHDEQEQIESYQQACNSIISQLGFQKVELIFSIYFS